MHKTSQKNKSKYEGSIYALSIFIHYPYYAFKILIVSPGLIFGEGFIFGKILGLVYRVSILGGLTFEISWYCTTWWHLNQVAFRYN